MKLKGTMSMLIDMITIRIVELLTGWTFDSSAMICILMIFAWVKIVSGLVVADDFDVKIRTQFGVVLWANAMISSSLVYLLWRFIPCLK